MNTSKSPARAGARNRAGYFKLPAIHTTAIGEPERLPAPDARRFRLRPAPSDRNGHGQFLLTRLSDGRTFLISAIFPWFAGLPADRDSWCASAFHECLQPRSPHGFGAFKDYAAFRARCDAYDAMRGVSPKFRKARRNAR